MEFSIPRTPSFYPKKWRVFNEVSNDNHCSRSRGRMLPLCSNKRCAPHHSCFFNFTQGSTGCIASPENIRQFEHLHTCFIRMSKGPRSSTSMYSRFWLVIAFLTSRIRTNKVSGQCHTAEYSVRGMYLRGHTFKNVQVELHETCYFKCTEEVTCQSYNFVIGLNICELNNRTKEARPEDFLPDEMRYYMKRLTNRGCYHVDREVLDISSKNFFYLSWASDFSTNWAIESLLETWGYTPH